MSSMLRLTVRFLAPVYHGRGDGGEPEWPPSPLRVFQALTAAFAPTGGSRAFDPKAIRVLDWLQKSIPEIVAPNGRVADRAYRLYVPNNASDLVAAAWKRGNSGASLAEHRTEKDVRPTHLSGDAIHYLFPLPPEGCPHEDVLNAAARRITHLGWGVDMVAADAAVISQANADKLPGHRWRVVRAGGVSLRVPKQGTLAALINKHEAFLGRLSADGFRPVPPLSCFEVVGYHSPTVPSAAPADPRPLAAFEILRTIEDQEQNPGKSRFRPFHQVRRVAAVAGMVRHAAAEVAPALGWDQERVKTFVCGHGDEKNGQATSDDRLQFLPLPSLQPVVGVGGIRRVLIVGPPGFDLAPLRRLLNGSELIDEKTKQPVAMLSQIATTDPQVRRFSESGTTWSTVTPVILPGHEDPGDLRRKYHVRVKAGLASVGEQKHLLERLDARVLALLWKAFGQAGWSPDALAGAELEYRSIGWFRGLDRARNYTRPDKLDRYPAYHVRVRFPHPIRGPLVVGAGRYRGLGLLAAESD